MSEILPLVDENDNIIGYKERDEVEPSDINRATGLWVFNSEGKILLARRSATKKNNPNRWGPSVAGTVAKDETYESCIIREAEEELGLKNIEFTFLRKDKSTGFNTHFVHWYSCVIDKEVEEFELQKEEVAEVRWYTKEEIAGSLEKEPDEFVDLVGQWLEHL